MIMESYREMYRKCCSDLVLTPSVTSITPNLSYSRILKGRVKSYTYALRQHMFSDI